MLTPEQIDALRDACLILVDPIIDFLISDIVRRTLEAGKATPTARKQAEILGTLGIGIPAGKPKGSAPGDNPSVTADDGMTLGVPKEVRLWLDTQSNLTQREIAEVYSTAAQLTWSQTIAGDDPKIEAFKQNEGLQNIVQAMTDMATGNMQNITQTLGMIDPFGNPQPLRSVYTAYSDYALEQVAIAGRSYQEAMQDAVGNIAKYGVQVIDYQSGVHTSLDAAVRRNIFGGMGLMVERIEQEAHDQTGANGWEISAHFNSAADHEPYQGRQYTDAQYKALNGDQNTPGLLHRRISTLNCKHIAFPIIIGVNLPQYTEEDLEQMKQQNEEGITFEGRHYTGYEATQMQRAIEREIRNLKRKILVYEQDPKTFSKELGAAQTRYGILGQRYRAFSSAAGLRTQDKRLEVLGFGPNQNPPYLAP